jgi:hypothetical protein
MIGYRVDAIAACEILLEREFPLCIYSTLMLLLGSQCVYMSSRVFHQDSGSCGGRYTILYWSPSMVSNKICNETRTYILPVSPPPPFGEREREREPSKGREHIIGARGLYAGPVDI